MKWKIDSEALNEKIHHLELKNTSLAEVTNLMSSQALNQLAFLFSEALGDLVNEKRQEKELPALKSEARLQKIAKHLLKEEDLTIEALTEEVNQLKKDSEEEKDLIIAETGQVVLSNNSLKQLIEHGVTDLFESLETENDLYQLETEYFGIESHLAENPKEYTLTIAFVTAMEKPEPVVEEIVPEEEIELEEKNTESLAMTKKTLLDLYNNYLDLEEINPLSPLFGELMLKKAVAKEVFENKAATNEEVATAIVELKEIMDAVKAEN